MKESFRIKDFEAYHGQNCETTTVGCLLKHLKINLSEPMLFGIGEGLGFIFWQMKSMDFPFFGGRIKSDLVTQNICKNLNLKLNEKETTSIAKAWSNVVQELEKGNPVGLKLDCYHLEYFTNKIHFAGHYASIYGYEKNKALLVDTQQQGGKVSTSLSSLAKARNEKGPMSSRNRSFTIEKYQDLPELSDVVREAIYRNALDYLNPPIKNLGYKGIQKAAGEIQKWFDSSKDIENEFGTVAMLMERAGTGGSLFRNLYRDFLFQSAEMLDCKKIHKGYLDFVIIAEKWKEVSNLFDLVGSNQSRLHLNKASKLLIEISDLEETAMKALLEAVS